MRINSAFVVMAKKFYAVAKGHQTGIFRSWPDCQKQVVKFPRPIFRGFETEAEARQFLAEKNVVVANKRNYDGNPHRGTMSQLGNGNVLTSPVAGGSGIPPQVGTYVNAQTVREMHTLRDTLRKISRNLTEMTNDTSKALGVTKVRSNLEAFTKDTTEALKTVDRTLVKFLGLPDDPKGDPNGDPVEVEKGAKRPKLEAVDDDVVDLAGKGFKLDDEAFVVVYTDGACKGNGRAGSKAGLGVFWGVGHPNNHSAPVPKWKRQTNNVAEILAAVEAVKIAKYEGIRKLCVKTDSRFMINCVTDWMPNWKLRNWTKSDGKPVENREELALLDALMRGEELPGTEAVKSQPVEVKWCHVRGHSGVEGNENADKLANYGALQMKN